MSKASRRAHRALARAARHAPRARADGGSSNYPYPYPGSLPSGVGGLAGSFAYDAADLFSRETADWLPWLRSPDSEINFDRDRVVARNRDLVRNDGWANGAVTRTLDNAIGSQFRLVAQPDYRALALHNPAFDATWATEFRRYVEAHYRSWADDPGRHCDAARQLTMTQQYRLALRHKLIDGDAFAVILWNPDRIERGGAKYATCVQLIDPDRISNPYQQMDTHSMRGGVEIDDLGAPIGYHIRRAHQNDWYDALESMTWDYFPRETPWGRPIVVHDFDQDRRGQHRGMGILTPVLSRLKMLTRYDQAELQQALIQTIFGTFITSPFDPADVEASLDDGGDMISRYQELRNDFHQHKNLTVGGARIPTLAPGEKLDTVAVNKPNNAFDSFQSVFLRNLAAQTGQSAEQLSWDYSKTNYSSARAALLEAWKTLARRRDDFAVGFCHPIYMAFLEELMEQPDLPMPRSGAVPDFLDARAAFSRCRWIGPARGWVDPEAERKGAILGLQAGFSTLQDECADQGLDFEEVLDQRQLENEMMKARGLELPQWANGEVTRSQGVATEG